MDHSVPEDVKMYEDFPSEVELRRSILLPYFHSARHQLVPCKLTVDKLVINRKSYTADTIADIPKEYHPPTTKNIGADMVGFYRKESPLSNFHPSKFSAGSKTFTSVEQFIVYKKAMHFQDTELAEEVLKLENPAKIKAKGRYVKGYNAKVWSQEQLKVMKEGLLCKFDQNPKLKAALAETRNKVLVEASPHDKFWGAGLSLFSPKLANPAEWPGQNKLGKLLAEVRRETCG
jgi:ribA/ribD-fused uncharacterized protein